MRSPSSISPLPPMGALRGVSLGSAPPAVMPRNPGTRDLVQMKRQLFLLRTSLQHRVSELSNLRASSEKRRAALEAAEETLLADEARFAELLRQDERRLREAQAAAEAADSRRLESAQRLGALRARAAAARLELERLGEEAAERARCRAFVEAVTPQEWTAAVLARAEEARRRAREEAEARAAEAWERAEAAGRALDGARLALGEARTRQQWERALAEEGAAKEAWEEAERGRRVAQLGVEALPNGERREEVDRNAGQLPSSPAQGDCVASTSDPAPAPLFESPAQLLRLVQSAQTEALDALVAVRRAETRAARGKAAAGALAAEHAGEESAARAQVRRLRARAGGGGEEAGGEGGAALVGSGDSAARGTDAPASPRDPALPSAELLLAPQAWAAVFEVCGLPLPDVVRDEPAAVEAFERAFVLLASSIDRLDLSGRVAAVETALAKQRRARSRRDKAIATAAFREKQQEAILKRAMAPPFKKVGKPPRPRSYLKSVEETGPATSGLPPALQGEEELGGDELNAYLGSISVQAAQLEPVPGQCVLAARA